MTISEELLSLLVCPKCKGELLLVPDQSGLDCMQCMLRYPVEDDIPVMLTSEAQAIEPDPQHGARR